MKSLAEEKRINVFQNIELIPLPPIQQDRFGNNQLRTVMEFQVGMASNEVNPKIMRVDRSGQWMGRKRFVTDPNKPVFDGSKAIAFQVDMEGNTVASSYKTNIVGKRIELIDDNVTLFDAFGFRRVEISSTNSSIDFYNELGILMGTIYGSNTPTPFMYLIADNDLLIGAENVNILVSQTVDLQVGGVGSSWTVWDVATDRIDFYRPIVLAYYSADPPAVNGGMYYNVATDKARVCENGVWVDIV